MTIMTDTPTDALARVRKTHRKWTFRTLNGQDADGCLSCRDKWPCPEVQLADDYERLQRERGGLAAIRGEHDCGCEVCSTVSTVCPASASSYALEILSLRTRLEAAESERDALQHRVERFERLGYEGDIRDE